MSKYKRVWAILGAVGLLGALMALAAVAPAATPAGASVPNNTINLTKIVSGTVPAQYVGQPFVIQVQCAPADADFDPATPDVAYSSGSAFNQDGSPIGGSNVVSISGAYTDCISFESQALGADSGLPNAVIVQGFGDANTDVTIAGGNDGTNPSAITFDGTGSDSASLFYVNSYAPTTYNTVRVVKQTTGIVPANAIFQIDVTCDPPGPAALYTASAVFVGGGGSQDLLVPTNCAGIGVTEVIAQPAPDSGDVAGVPLPGPAPVTFAAGSSGQLRTVTVTNNYGGPVNTITIRKTVVGTPPVGTTFAGLVSCPNIVPGGPAVVRNWAFNATGGTTQLTFPSNVGNANQNEFCTAIELDNGGASSVSTNVFPVISGVVLFQVGQQGVFGFANSNGGHTATVEHVNRFLTGPVHTINVTKNITGTPPAGAIFIVRIDCTYDIDGPGPDDDVYFMAFGEGLGNSQSLETVVPPIGNGCVVQETNSAGAQSRSYAVGSTSPNTSAAAVQDSTNPPVLGGVAGIWGTTTPSDFTTVITNRFHNKPLADNTLRIKKQLRGRIPAGATFDIRVRCSGGGIIDVFNLTFSSNSFQEIAVPYNRSNCVVQETANGGAQSVSYFASSATADATDGPNSGRVDFGTTVGGQRGKVIVRNQFPGTCPRPGPKFC